MPRIKEQALKADLAKRGFESVSIKRELPGGRIQVEANKLSPVHARQRDNCAWRAFVIRNHGHIYGAKS
jgi:hypothetical protein